MACSRIINMDITATLQPHSQQQVFLQMETIITLSNQRAELLCRNVDLPLAPEFIKSLRQRE